MIVIDKKTDALTLVNFKNNIQRLNIVLAEKFKTKMNAIIDAGCKKLVLDCSGIQFIDSSGFGALVNIYNHAKNRESAFILCNISKETMQLIKITKLDQVFDIRNHLDDALN